MPTSVSWCHIRLWLTWLNVICKVLVLCHSCCSLQKAWSVLQLVLLTWIVVLWCSTITYEQSFILIWRFINREIVNRWYSCKESVILTVQKTDEKMSLDVRVSQTMLFIHENKGKFTDSVRNDVSNNTKNTFDGVSAFKFLTPLILFCPVSIWTSLITLTKTLNLFLFMTADSSTYKSNASWSDVKSFRHRRLARISKRD